VPHNQNKRRMLYRLAFEAAINGDRELDIILKTFAATLRMKQDEMKAAVDTLVVEFDALIAPLVRDRRVCGAVGVLVPDKYQQDRLNKLGQADYAAARTFFVEQFGPDSFADFDKVTDLIDRRVRTLTAQPS
jgi:succinate dehydrogenase flavin-adding protein (antitoxin of CptAB toxin-antitoxin module)